MLWTVTGVSDISFIFWTALTRHYISLFTDCRVLYHSACCFHPTCYSKSPKKCSWLNYFTGVSCFFITFSLQPNFRPLLSQTWQHPEWQLELPNSGAAHTWRHILGQWHQHLPWWAIFYQNPIIPLPLSALQCRLDCNPGYVAHKAPIITCVNGQYQPQARLWQESEPLKETIFFCQFCKDIC